MDTADYVYIPKQMATIFSLSILDVCDGETKSGRRACFYLGTPAVLHIGPQLRCAPIQNGPNGPEDRDRT